MAAKDRIHMIKPINISFLISLFLLFCFIIQNYLRAEILNPKQVQRSNKVQMSKFKVQIKLKYQNPNDKFDIWALSFELHFLPHPHPIPPLEGEGINIGEGGAHGWLLT